jgi:hypothetical protein
MKQSQIVTRNTKHETLNKQQQRQILLIREIHNTNIIAIAIAIAIAIPIERRRY